MKGKNKEKKNVLSKLMKEVRKKGNPQINAKLNREVEEPMKNKKDKNIKSNLEAKNLDEFLDLAKLSQKKYEVLNEQVVLQNLNTEFRDFNQNQFSNVLLNNMMKNSEVQQQDVQALAIPKRPKWKEGISAKEFERTEREAFLNWRRALADEEEKNINMAITPFEKNIEVWRQLWLVVEKCQILIQIVDGRNPLFFRCPDLEFYIKDTDPGKDYILLVNKADLLSKEIRKSWADYFKEKKINFAFFSALEEAIKLEQEEENQNSDEEQEDDDDEDVKDNLNKFKGLDIKAEIEELDQKEHLKTEKVIEKPEEITKKDITKEVNTEGVKEEENKNTAKIDNTEIKDKLTSTEEKEDESVKVLNREELITWVKTITKNKSKSQNSNCYYVGFIGYPNVGKSSVINVLMRKKRVGVASMPGKTKHYQTLFLPEDKDFCLMDCPGLVFPSFVYSKADMLVNGILPIDQLKDYHSAIAIIIKKIPRKILEHFYRIILPDVYSATQFLQILATKRGFYSGRALPDEAKTSKWVLKDFVSGKLLYCYLRPDYNAEIHGPIIPYMSVENVNITEEEKEKQEIINEVPADFDDNYEKIFFENIEVLENKKVMDNEDNNFDNNFFTHEMEEHNLNSQNKDRKVTKDMKRALKFAMKRGEITEEEYEDAITFEDFELLLIKIQKAQKVNQKELVEKKKIEF
jgi:large subunit GTPase 1